MPLGPLSPPALASFVKLVLAAALLLVALAGCSDADGGNKAAENPTAAQSAPASTAPANLPKGKGFDFYVLALSWSPSFCLGANADPANQTQCATGRKLGFVVHGLWPQFEHGYPEYCPSSFSDRVGQAAGNQMLDMVPSLGLLGHMWRKHGVCAGLSQQDYFAVVRAARSRVEIPGIFANPPRGLSSEAAESAFAAANPGMTAKGIAAVCKGGRLQEVRICLTDALEFRACREVDAAGCQAGSLAVPPPR